MRVLISGGDGMLARALQKSFACSTVFALNRKEMDITKQEDTLRAAYFFKPDLIINAAAFTQVDDCELNPEKSFLVNALGAGNMAVASQATKARFVHFSTDYVFDGFQKVPYQEDDKPNPLSVYGETKLAGEKLVSQLCKRHFIIRTSWLFGEWGENFIKYILQKLQQKEVVQAAVDQISIPTFTVDLSNAIKNLVEKSDYGMYHLTNSGFCNRYQLAREIARIVGSSDRLVIPIKMNNLNLLARRPLYTVLDNTHWQERGFPPLRHYSQALRDFLKHKTVPPS